MKRYSVFSSACCVFLTFGGVAFASVSGTTTATVVTPTKDCAQVGPGNSQVTATGEFTFTLSGGSPNQAVVVEYEGIIKVDGVGWASVNSGGVANRELTNLDSDGKWKGRPAGTPVGTPLRASDMRGLANGNHTFAATSTFKYRSTSGGTMTSAANGNDDKTFYTSPVMTATPGDNPGGPPTPGNE